MKPAKKSASGQMDKEYMTRVHDTIIYSHQEKGNMVFFRKMDRTGNHHVKQNKPHAERQSPTSHMKNTALKSITISYNNICINTFKCTH